MITDGFWQELLRYQDSVVRWSVVRLPTVPSTIFITAGQDSISTTAMSKTLVEEPLSTHPVQPHAERAQSTRTQNERRTRCDCTITGRTCSDVGPSAAPVTHRRICRHEGAATFLGAMVLAGWYDQFPESPHRNANRSRGRSPWTPHTMSKRESAYMPTPSCCSRHHPSQARQSRSRSNYPTAHLTSPARHPWWHGSRHASTPQHPIIDLSRETHRVKH